MNIRDGIEPIAFLRQVKKCKDEVLFCTTEGDVINLKSTLSQMVFAVAAENTDVLYTAEIICKNESDREIISEFLKN